MVSEKLLHPTIKAIEGLISIARFRALQGSESSELAEILDSISYLPLLLLDKIDRTNDVLEALKQIAEKVPESQFVLQEFEAHLTE